MRFTLKSLCLHFLPGSLPDLFGPDSLLQEYQLTPASQARGSRLLLLLPALHPAAWIQSLSKLESRVPGKTMEPEVRQLSMTKLLPPV